MAHCRPSDSLLAKSTKETLLSKLRSPLIIENEHNGRDASVELQACVSQGIAGKNFVIEGMHAYAVHADVGAKKCCTQGGQTRHSFIFGHPHNIEEADGTSVCLQVSEEIEEEIIIEGGGDYSVMFDPLDGSSNIDCGVSIGTIYGIFKKPAAEAACVKNVLRVPFLSLLC